MKNVFEVKNLLLLKKLITLPVLVFVFSFLFYLIWWHGIFYGYELEIAQSALSILNGTYEPTRVGWSPVILYLPFCILKEIFQFHIETLSLVPHFYTALTLSIISMILNELQSEVSQKIHIFTVISIGIGTVMWPTTNHGMEYSAMLYLGLTILYFSKWTKNIRKVFPLVVSMVLLANSKVYGIALIAAILIPMFIHLKSIGQLTFYKTKNFLVFFLIPTIFSFFTVVDNLLRHKTVAGSYNLREIGTEKYLWEGFYGILFSNGKGIFPLNPMLIVCICFWPNFYRKNKRVSECILLSTFIIYVINANSQGWSDERWISRGTPIFIPFIALSILECYRFTNEHVKHYLKKIVVFSIIIVSIYIQLLGSLYPYWTLRVVLRNNNTKLDSKEMMRYVPSLTSLYFHHRLFKSYVFAETDLSDHIYFYGEKGLHRPNPDGHFHIFEFNLNQLNKPNLWWMN